MKFIFYTAIFLLSACAKDLSQHGKVTPYGSLNSGSQAFIFKVDDRFVASNQNSKSNLDNPILSNAEAELLNQILIRQKQCVGESSKPRYVITSKQEKIYDITFANLIEQNYNAKPASPRMYYGRCL